VEPLLEYWGIAKTLGSVADALNMAGDAGPEGIRILADVFHTVKGKGGIPIFSPWTQTTLGSCTSSTTFLPEQRPKPHLKKRSES